MKLITIGDLHGRDIWKKIVEAESDADKFIFMGDYVDSFTLTDTKIAFNLQEIIDFKKENLDRVILLWGNHDYQYYKHPYGRCSGWRSSMQIYLENIFKINQKLFQYAFQYRDILWTHAGVNEGWYKITKEYFEKTSGENFAELINNLGQTKYEVIFSCVSLYRGGVNCHSGILWSDSRENRNFSSLMKDHKIRHQIVGHSQFYEIHTQNNYTYVDVNHVEDFDNLKKMYLKMEV